MNTVEIPDDWTPEESLTVVAFLQNIIDAVWDKHSEQMSQHEDRLERLRRPLILNTSELRRRTEPDYNLPF